MLAPPVDVYLTDAEAAELRALSTKMRELPPGEERSRLLSEITTRLDIHAYFPRPEVI